MQTNKNKKNRRAPSARLEVSFNSEDPEPPSRDSLSLWINTTLQFEPDAGFAKHTQIANATHSTETHKRYRVSLYIVDEGEAQDYNKTYRNKSYPTNVLSFPGDTHDLSKVQDDIFLGDILACAPVIRREAKSQEKSLNHHWAHMIVHSTLHLLGYDHQHETEATLMENLEIQILSKLKIPNPYEAIRVIDHE